MTSTTYTAPNYLYNLNGTTTFTGSPFYITNYNSGTSGTSTGYYTYNLIYPAVQYITLTYDGANWFNTSALVGECRRCHKNTQLIKQRKNYCCKECR